MLLFLLCFGCKSTIGNKTSLPFNGKPFLGIKTGDSTKKVLETLKNSGLKYKIDDNEKGRLWIRFEVDDRFDFELYCVVNTDDNIVESLSVDYDIIHKLGSNYDRDRQIAQEIYDKLYAKLAQKYKTPYTTVDFDGTQMSVWIIENPDANKNKSINILKSFNFAGMHYSIEAEIFVYSNEGWKEAKQLYNDMKKSQ